MENDDKAWFAQKQYGLGSGMPIAWQGWLSLIAYIALATGLAFMATQQHGAKAVLTWIGFFAATLLFCLICWRKTRGGWKWRWGGD